MLVYHLQLLSVPIGVNDCAPPCMQKPVETPCIIIYNFMPKLNKLAIFSRKDMENKHITK